MRIDAGRGPAWFYAFLLVCACVVAVTAQDCSASNPCATGCCSRFGYCGVGDDFCGADCVANCNYEEGTECDANKPCALGCCSKFGICGYGPDYCTAENCVSSCGQKSECDPGDWGTSLANRSSCPLNVCCSPYGFCGTTDEFCGDKKVKRPSCTGQGSTTRVIGYYEGWASRRPCNYFFPEQIETNVYTHLIYAFATIDPETFEIKPATHQEGELMKRLTGLKKRDQGLKVSVAVGGWTFNDPGQTATTFSDLAASQENQEKFFKSLISFLSTYNFDGIDVDWEYPVADDRSGRPEDFDNFPRFMANLKKALKATDGRDELSLTIPTSYWYLQHFDIKALEPHIDFFNYMSYDLHGTWDRGNKWTGSFLNAHTNLTEIRGTLDLLWRNNIQPDKVILGLAFYSRAFTVENTNCMDPGCTFLSASTPGPCSAEAGILLNNELDEIRKERGISGTLDENAGVKLMSWDDQWTAYDDEETLRMKIEFAQETCLGGIMVWAVSHDNYDNTYARALLGAVPPRTKPHNLIEVDEEGETITVRSHKPQCRWTGCGQTCPNGFTTIDRKDGGETRGELMIDGTNCENGLVQTLCCPNTHAPKCGWYTFNNGKCDGTCPDGMFEIGSHTKGCRSGYQAACCESRTPTTDLYDVLQWSAYPYCYDGTCPAFEGGPKRDILVESKMGSGGVDCYARLDEEEGWVADGRKLCYNPDRELKTWEDCDWYSHFDPPPDGKPEGYCTPTCPIGKVRLAMEMTRECMDGGGGARAFCCSDSFYTTSTQRNPLLKDFETLLNLYFPDGSCEFLQYHELGEVSALAARQTTILLEEFYNKTVMTVADTLAADPPDAMDLAVGRTWNGWAIRHEMENLAMQDVRSQFKNKMVFLELGAVHSATDLVCRPTVYNETREQDERVLPCLGDPCDADADPDLCKTEEWEMSEIPHPMPNPDELPADPEDYPSLLKRVSPKVFQVYCHNPPAPARPGWVSGLSIKPRDYPPAGGWAQTSFVFQHAISFMAPGDCSNPRLISQIKTGSHHDTEHIVELQTIAQFLQHATAGILIDGRPGNWNPLPCQMFLPARLGGLNILADQLLLPSAFTPLYRDDLNTREIAARIMNAIGSNQNAGNFWLLEKTVNGMKSRIFRNVNLVAGTRRSRMIANVLLPGQILGEIRAAIAVWVYLNEQDIVTSHRELTRNVRAVFTEIENRYNFAYPNNPIDLVNAWNEWHHHMLQYQARRTYDWVIDTITRTELVWQAVPSNNRMKASVLGSLQWLRFWANIYVNWNHPAF